MRALAHLQSLPLVGSAIARLEEMRDARLRALPPSNQWLPGATRALTPNRYWRLRRPELVKPVEVMVWHYTASPYNPRYPMGSDIERIKRWARGKGRQSSTHVVYLRDGRRVQLMPFSDRAWHVTNRYPHPVTGKPLNPDALAADLDNVGFLTKKGGSFYNDYGSVHRGPVAFDDDGRPWEAVTDEQLRAIEDDARYIAAWYPQLGDGAEGRVIRHSDAQPTRSDPGPMFDTDWYARLLQGPVDAA